MFKQRKVGPSRRVTGKLFVSRVSGSPSFVGKCRKRWFVKGSSGRREGDPSAPNMFSPNK